MTVDLTEFTRPPGQKFEIHSFDPGNTGKYDKKKDAREGTEENLVRLQQLHEKLYASGSQGLLVVLQATDTGGKDGTIRHVFDGINPQGVKVASFKKPTPSRAWPTTTCGGSMPRRPDQARSSIFNRSPTTRTSGGTGPRPGPRGRLVPSLRPHQGLRATAGRRGHHHRQVLPAHLQGRTGRAAARARLDDPTSTGSSAPATSSERKLWDDYHAAFEDMLSRTSTADAPWYVVPGRPQVVPQPGGHRYPGPDHGGHGLGLSRSAAPHRGLRHPGRLIPHPPIFNCELRIANCPSRR